MGHQSGAVQLAARGGNPLDITMTLVDTMDIVLQWSPLMKRTRPSELELQVLAVLWDRGPSSVRDIMDAMPDGKARAYTTVLSVVQVMEKKGLVDHERCGQAYVYRALANRQEILTPMLKQMLQNVFGGSPADALQCLLDSTAVDDAELTQIRRVIRDAARKNNEQGETS
jgi:BlaI family transcriptional regulator, penicillinase repressor